MSATEVTSLSIQPAAANTRRKLIGLSPALTAMAYPFFLQEFHAAVSPPDGILSLARLLAAAGFLCGAFAMPLLGFGFAYRLAGVTRPSGFDLRARRLAYLSIASPPLFVFTGVTLGLARLPLPDIIVWIVAWLAVGIIASSGSGTIEPQPAGPSITRWRVAHGVAAAAIACFVLFHLTNHLFGLVGPDTHAAIMKSGRTIYRSPFVEPLLVGLLLFQVTSGIRLAWRWSSIRLDAARVFQIGSGAYLAAFILTHMNSVFISARAVHKIETGWAYASGAPTGLIHDAWNIRLLPHYALGVFFILGHLASGLRGVMIAHGISMSIANRIWIAGLAGAGLVSVAIISGLCGIRV